MYSGIMSYLPSANFRVDINTSMISGEATAERAEAVSFHLRPKGQVLAIMPFSCIHLSCAWTFLVRQSAVSTRL